MVLKKKKSAPIERLVRRAELFSAMELDPRDFPADDDMVALGLSADNLGKDQIGAAVVVMAELLNLSSGNSGGCNLYELNDLYIRNPAARAEINEVLIRRGIWVNGIYGWNFRSRSRSNARSNILCPRIHEWPALFQ